MGGYLSILQALSCPVCSDVTLYISHHMTVLEAKSGASICGSLFEILRAPLMFVFVFQEAWGEEDKGGRGREEGGMLKSDKLLKIAFTQSFLFGHTWHIWL